MFGVQTFAEAFRGIVCHLSLELLLGLIAIAAIAWLSRTLAVPMRRLLGGGIVRIALVAAMVGTGIVESFSKHTNDPPRSVASPLPSITPVDISNGWRVAEMREGGDLSRPLDGSCVIHEPWLLRGGFSDMVRISANGWFFPWRDGFADGLTVFSDGEIRPNLRTSFFPRTFDVPLAVAPAFNWHLLTGGVSNVFWHASTSSNSLLVAWENAPVNRDANSLTNFQAEFFADGRFAYRYDDHAVDYLPVFPFDWDNDGLENSVDPDPLVAGPDAHGTNAEWYNTVCSNIVNSNAYYVVDVVAERGPAPIRFIGDRESCLGNPVIVALCGETNHVPLLMGVEYTVTSTVPFSVSAPANAIVSSAGASDGRACFVKWPLTFGIAAASGGGYEVEVLPFDPGGEFSWSAAGGGLNLRGASGCAYTSVSNWIGFVCGEGGNCGCNGCSVDGTYSIEDATFTLPSLWCGCRASEYGGMNEPPSTPSVSVSFDKAVVFYEDAYTNAPNDVVAKHSTNTTLTVSAYGGVDGGMLYVSAQKMDKLVRTGGNAIAYPYTAFVPPHGSVSFSIEYEAETHSDSGGDIIVTASLLPGSGGGTPCTASDCVTAAEILIVADVDFPSGFRSRHIYGVAEIVQCTVRPSLPNVTWYSSDTNAPVVTSSNWEYEMPSSPNTVTFDVSCSGSTFPITMTSIAPTGFFVPRDPDVVIYPNVQIGDSGGFGMCIDLGILPTNVCFSRILVVEGISSNDVHTGYYADKTNDWHHGLAEGSWKEWIPVTTSNYAEQDMVTSATNAPPWQSGVLCWHIPNYWRTVSDPTTNFFCITPQTFRMYADGTQSISKFDWIAVRPTNTVTQIQYGKIRR